MRVEPQIPAHRGSEWPRPVAARQGDPEGALCAALTRRPVEAGFDANSLGRFAMCSIATCLILATLGTAPTAAQSAAHRVLAEKLDLTQSPMGNVQLQIWSDKLDAIIANRRQLLSTVPNLNLKLTTTAFTTSFKDGDRTIVVSAMHYQCASSHDTPFKLECPARVVELRGGKIRLLAEVADFPISAKRGEAGFDASTNSNTQYMTVLTFDPADQQIAAKVTYDGETSSETPIKLR